MLQWQIWNKKDLKIMRNKWEMVIYKQICNYSYGNECILLLVLKWSKSLINIFFCKL